MTKRRKEAKYVYDESVYAEELKEIKEKEEKEKIRAPSTECPSKHPLSIKNWSTVRRKYFCPQCIKEFSKDDLM